MEYRSLPNTGLTSSVIGFGCRNFIGAPDRREVQASLEEAIERGVTFFDTADAFGEGLSERVLGKAIRGRREGLVICSKAGRRFGLKTRLMTSVRPKAARLIRPFRRRGGTAGKAMARKMTEKNFDAGYLEAALRRSLRRLGTDYLDLFLLHSPSTDVLASAAAFDALDGFVAKGLIRHHGISCATDVTAAEACAFLRHPRVSILQLPVNLRRTDLIAEALPLALERRVTIIAREAFARGEILTDRSHLEALGESPARTPAQTALRFALQQEGVDLLLVGMRQRAHLREDLAALTAPALSEAELRALATP